MENKIDYFEIRKIALEARQLEQGTKVISGIIPYNSLSRNLGGFKEIIGKTAFNRSLTNGSDIKALVAHNEEKCIGSTRSGTLKLTSTDEGLLCECSLPNTTYANDLFESVMRGDISEMSFGFKANQTEYDVSGIRKLQDVTLFEVSYGVTWGAYGGSYSNAYLRSLFDKRNIDLVTLANLMEKQNNNEELSADEISKVREIANNLVPNQQNLDADKIIENVNEVVNVETKDNNNPPSAASLEADKMKLWIEVQKLKNI